MAADLRIVKSYEFTRFFPPCLYLRPLPTFYRSRARLHSRGSFAVEAFREIVNFYLRKLDFEYYAVIIR